MPNMVKIGLRVWAGQIPSCQIIWFSLLFFYCTMLCAEHSYAAVCRLFVCDVQVPWSHRLAWNTSKIISWRNSLRYTVTLTPTSAIWCNGNTPKSGWIGVRSWAQKPAISLKRCKIGPRLLWRTNWKETLFPIFYILCQKIHGISWLERLHNYSQQTDERHVDSVNAVNQCLKNSCSCCKTSESTVCIKESKTALPSVNCSWFSCDSMKPSRAIVWTGSPADSCNIQIW